MQQIKRASPDLMKLQIEKLDCYHFGWICAMLHSQLVFFFHLVPVWESKSIHQSLEKRISKAVWLELEHISIHISCPRPTSAVTLIWHQFSGQSSSASGSSPAHRPVNTASAPPGCFTVQQLCTPNSTSAEGWEDGVFLEASPGIMKGAVRGAGISWTPPGPRSDQVWAPRPCLNRENGVDGWKQSQASLLQSCSVWSLHTEPEFLKPGFFYLFVKMELCKNTSTSTLTEKDKSYSQL